MVNLVGNHKKFYSEILWQNKCPGRAFSGTLVHFSGFAASALALPREHCAALFAAHANSGTNLTQIISQIVESNQIHKPRQLLLAGFINFSL